MRQGALHRQSAGCVKKRRGRRGLLRSLRIFLWRLRNPLSKQKASLLSKKAKLLLPCSPPRFSVL